MFRGDHPDLVRAIGRAATIARGLGHPRVGSEHLLFAVNLVGHEAAILSVIRRAEPAGAGAAADRFPPPPRNPLLRLERRLAGPARQRAVVRRYRRTTGRVAMSSQLLTG